MLICNGFRSSNLQINTKLFECIDNCDFIINKKNYSLVQKYQRKKFVLHIIMKLKMRKALAFSLNEIYIFYFEGRSLLLTNIYSSFKKI